MLGIGGNWIWLGVSNYAIEAAPCALICRIGVNIIGLIREVGVMSKVLVLATISCTLAEAKSRA